MSDHRTADHVLPADVQANLDHAIRLHDKIESLIRALDEVTSALAQSIQRSPITMDQAIDIYLLTEGMPNRSRICSATGWSASKIRYFISEGRDRARLGRSYIPPDGVHCVYALFRHGVCVYVGRSKAIRKRIKTHKKTGNDFDYLEVYPVTSLQESQDLEAILQQQHRPIRNKRTEKRVA